MAFDGSPLPLAELSRQYGEMAWLEARLFEVVGYWSALESHNAASVLFAETSRHHGWHAELWEDALPDSPSLGARAAIVPPHHGWIDLLNRMVALNEADQTGDRVAVLALVVDPWLRNHSAQLMAAANPVADRAVQRIQHFIDLDHRDDHAALLRLHAEVPGASSSIVPAALFPLIGENR